MFHNRNNGGPKYSQLPYVESESDSEDDEVQRQVKSQRKQLKEQDEGLEMLSESANRLGKLSLGISEELTQQNKLLDGMENDLDSAATNLDFVTAQTKQLIKSAGGKRNLCIIVVLTLISIFLLILILYT